MFNDVVIRRIGENRGAPRVFLDMPELARAEFSPGAFYKLHIDQESTKISLVVDPDGDRVVSSKRKGEKQVPVIDLSSFRVLRLFEGFERVRIVFMRGRVFVLPLASEMAQRERLERVLGKLRRGEELTMASLCHGAGLMSMAAHEGLREANVRVRAAVINEIDEQNANQSRGFNPVWDERTKGLIAPMQELMQDEWVMSHLPKTDIVEAGIPCSGASKAGVTKRKLACMEAHPEVGHLIVAYFALLQKLQPAVVILENVSDYANTGSAHIARSQLRDMGYEVVELELNGADFGALESRTRWFLVAVTKGLSVEMGNLAPILEAEPMVRDILDDIDPEDPRWTTRDYLKDKAERDKANGKGFKMQTFKGTDSKVPTLRKGYAKGGTCDPLLEHPSKPGYLRKLTAREHARVKGFPVSLIEGLSQYDAHAMLGQGVVMAPVKAIFKRIGECLVESAKGVGNELAVGSGVQRAVQRQQYSLDGTG